MRIRPLLPTVLTVALAVAAATPAPAGVDVDLGVRADVGDAELFFGISSRYFDREPDVVARTARRVAGPDDLAVSLFIASRSRRDVDDVLALRSRGLTWWDVSVRLGVPPDAYFLPVERDPGPPYGKAYGYWNKHRRNPKARIVLTDADVRNLVAVRFAHEYYGVPVDVAMRWRAEGRDVRSLMVSKYRERHGGGKHGERHERRDDDHGKNKGHGSGKGKHDR